MTCRRQALLAISLGHIGLAVVIVSTGTIGARLCVPFTILARLSFGFWFSSFSVMSLIVLSMFWSGIQTYIGSECVYKGLRLLSHSEGLIGCDGTNKGYKDNGEDKLWTG
jgi:nucleobase:cation symporter-1, NCS1 family